jgi:hypothetical protein
MFQSADDRSALIKPSFQIWDARVIYEVSRQGDWHLAHIGGTIGDAALQDGHDHAWRYFEIHSNHRMSMFNFFTVLSGLTVAGIGATLQGPQKFSAIGVLLGVALALLSYVFWKLDQRSSFLVKHAECAQGRIEEEILPKYARLFGTEDEALTRANDGKSYFRQTWTFGRSLRWTFLAMGLVGILSASLSAYRTAGYIDWAERPTTQKAANAVGQTAQVTDAHPSRPAIDRAPVVSPKRIEGANK